VVKKTKICSTCGKRRLITRFSKSNKTKDGFGHTCRDCSKPMGRPRETDPIARELGNLAANDRPTRQITPWEYSPKRKQGESLSDFKVRGVIDFFEKELKHSRDEWAGQPFVLNEWEKDLNKQLYGTLDKGGLRQYREVYCSMAKLGGKTQFAAGLALYHLFHDGKGTEVYCASGDRAQAGLVFDAAVGMLLQNKNMADAVKVSESQ